MVHLHASLNIRDFQKRLCRARKSDRQSLVQTVALEIELQNLKESPRGPDLGDDGREDQTVGVL